MRTVSAEFELWPGTVIAASQDITAQSVLAVVEVSSKRTCFFKAAMVFDFFGNGSAVFAGLSSDFLKAASVIESSFDDAALINSHMFMVCHSISFSAGIGEGHSLLSV